LKNCSVSFGGAVSTASFSSGGHRGHPTLRGRWDAPPSKTTQAECHAARIGVPSERADGNTTAVPAHPRYHDTASRPQRAGRGEGGEDGDDDGEGTSPRRGATRTMFGRAAEQAPLS
jgi:hypothetical protein